jgi:hypothetical protein
MLQLKFFVSFVPLFLRVHNAFKIRADDSQKKKWPKRTISYAISQAPRANV